MSLLISLVESLKPFGYISIVATIVVILSVFSITTYNLIFLFQTNIDLTNRLGHFNFPGFLSFLGIALYTTEGIGLVLPIRASFKDNKGFGKVFYGTFIFIVWCYLALGILSYIRFYDDTQHVIFFNFGTNYIYMFILEVFYACAIFFSNPINLFPIFESIYKTKTIENILLKSSTNR